MKSGRAHLKRISISTSLPKIASGALLFYMNNYIRDKFTVLTFAVMFITNGSLWPTDTKLKGNYISNISNKSNIFRKPTIATESSPV